MLCYQSWHEMNQDLTPVMLPILTWEKTWVESSHHMLEHMIGNVTYDETWVVSSIKKLDDCQKGTFSYTMES